MKMSGWLLCALLLFLRLPCCSQASDIVLTGPELEAVRAELQSMRSEVQLLQGLLTKQSGSSEILQARCRTLEDELREAQLSLERSGQKAVELQKTQEQLRQQLEELQSLYRELNQSLRRQKRTATAWMTAALACALAAGIEAAVLAAAR